MKLAKAPGRTIKLYITGEDPRSLRTVELDNWWGMAVMGRAEYFKRALEREELSRACVYLLVQSAGADDIPEVYVGESDDFAQRYPSEKFPIEFDTFIVFTNKDENLTKAHVKWLELKLWEMLVQNAGKVTVANRSKPSGARLPEAEVATMITFSGNMVYILEALGFEFFGMSVTEENGEIESSGSSVEPPGQIERYFTTTLPRKDSAKAHLDALPSGYILKAGSMINKIATDSLAENVRKLRDQLIRDGVLVDRGDCYQLKDDIPFAKPSPASALVKGRSSTGYSDWLRTSDEKRLGEVLRLG